MGHLLVGSSAPMEHRILVYTLADALRAGIYKRRVSMRSAGRDMGISAPTMSRILRGRGFELKWAIPIAKWLGLTPQQLWDLLDAQNTEA